MHKFLPHINMIAHPRTFIKIAFHRLIDMSGGICFLCRKKIVYADKLSKDLLCGFEWRHIIGLNGLISADRYLSLCRQIFECNVNRLMAQKHAKVCFVVYVDTSWSSDKIYWLLDADERFEVCVLVIPFPNLDRSYEEIKCYFTEKNYKTYEIREKSWQDSDIFIYQTPYDLQVRGSNISDRKLSELPVMIPYAVFQGDDDDEHLEGDYNRFSRCIWRYYCYTDYSFQYGKKNNSLGTINMRFSGYPKMDVMYGEAVNPPAWYGAGKKRILFAPSMIWKYSAFMETWKIMLHIAEEYRDVAWIFRPHPLLGSSLLNTHKIADKQIYEAYLDAWRNLENAEVQIGGDYADTFKTSDAMIADGTSFLTNYQYVHKPLLFLQGSREQNLSQYGRDLYDCIYICSGDYEKQIRNFIDEVVIRGNDVLHKKRNVFFKNNLDYKSRNGVLASEFIYDDFCKSIFEESKIRETGGLG